jgi:hypothetical protein
VAPTQKKGILMKKKKVKKDPHLKYNGQIKLMSRGAGEYIEYIWVEWFEIRLKIPFSWKLVTP